MAVIDRAVCGGSTQVLVDAQSDLIDRMSMAGKAATVTLFGDSFSAYDRFSDAGNNYQDSSIQAGCWSFLLAKLGENVNVVNYAGVGGDNFLDMETRITDVTASPTDWTFMQGGVNDIYADFRTAAQMIGNVITMIDAIVASGSKVLMLNCYAQESGRGGYSASRAIIQADYNKQLWEYIRPKEGVIMADVFTDSVDQSDNNVGSARAFYIIGDDKIHLSMYGAFRTGEICEQVLAPYLVGDSNNKVISPVTSGDYGDLNFSNFNATGGTAGTGMSGVVPTGWVVKRNSGEGTMVGSQNAKGFYELAITKSVAGTSSVYRIQSNDLKALFSGGEEVETRIVLSVDTALDVEEIRCYWYNDNSVDPFFTVDWGRSINGFSIADPITAEDLLIKLAPSTILDTPLTNVWLFIDIRLIGSGVGTVTLKNVRITDV